MSRFGFLVGAAILGWLVAPASANTVANFTLNGVTFSDGGTATGGFTLDLTTSTISNVNITTSVDGVLGNSYTSFGTFTNSPSPIGASFGLTELFIPVSLYELGINLSDALTDSDLLSPHSFIIASGSETHSSLGCFITPDLCDSRTIASGSLDAVPADSVATPLPATLPLFASGLGALCVIERRRRRKQAGA
jgi:hypothetical protein